MEMTQAQTTQTDYPRWPFPADLEKDGARKAAAHRERKATECAAMTDAELIVHAEGRGNHYIALFARAELLHRGFTPVP
jgi:hypothetical protein